MKNKSAVNSKYGNRLQRPTGSFLKPVFQITFASNYKSVAVFKIAADSPEEAEHIAKKMVEESLVIYPGEDLGIPEGVVDSIGSTGLIESCLVGVIPALKKGGFD